MHDVISRLLEHPLNPGFTAFTVVLFSYVAFKGLQYMASKTPSISYPPGPKRDPLIGTLRSFPRDHLYRHFCKWAKVYGDIVYAPLPGMDIVVLNSYEMAQELLSRRPNSTAGRRLGYFVLNLMGWYWSTAVIQPGPSHSSQRKMLRRISKLMITLSRFKGNPIRPVQSALGQMITTATYGEKIRKEMGDKLAHWNLEAMTLSNEALFAFWMVDIIHILRFVPSWFPGAHFKKIGQYSTHLTTQLRHRAYERAQELYNTGTLGHCIANDLMDEFGQNGDVRDAMAILYTAGSETTTAAVTSFLHAMFLFPEVSRKVFEEIQSVTYGERLPKITDRPHLTFCEAVWKEAIRWRPFMPIGVPHVNNEDEIINGYFIPKGTSIHQNHGLMLTDPRVWGDPEVFRPERFLEDEAVTRPNPLVLIFGYGIRVCSGMYLADKVAFHLVVTTMALFDITPLDGCKVPDPNTIEYTDTAFQHPIGFECQFESRNKKTKQFLNMISLDE
ncbi:cytochrome P450 [Serendipita vermifera]|nr:cytochrome P450 [Serendipita vermifera]